MRIIRDRKLYSSPLEVFRRVIKPYWPTPGAGSGVVCLFPTQPLLESWEENLIQEGGSYGGARFLLFAGLIREIWEEQRTDWTSLSGEAVSLILRRVFTQLKATGEIPYYAQALTSSGFFSALREEITTLKRSGVSAQALRGWVVQGLAGERPALRDFSLLYQEYQELLSTNKWADQEEKLALATADLPKSAWVKSLSHLFVIGFSDFTTGQERFLQEFARVTEVTVVIDASAEGRQGVYSPRLRREKPAERGEEKPPGDRGVSDVNLSYLQSALWTTGPAPATPPAKDGDGTLRFLQIDGGWRREMKAIALEVKKALSKSSTLDPAQIGIITPYTGNIEEIYEIFTATGLLVTGQTGRVLRFQPVARALLQPFVTVAQGFSWAEMVKLLRWVGVIPGAELYSLLPEGLEEWKRVVRDLYPDAETESLLDFLGKIPEKARIGEYFHLCRLWLGSPELLRSLLPTENTNVDSSRASQVTEVSCMQRAGFMQTSLVATAQEILAQLDPLADLIADWEISLADFILILEDILSTGTKSIPYGWGNGVRILSPQEARGLRFKVTFLTGLNEGLWPTHTSTGWALEEGDLSFWRRQGFSLRTAAEDLSLQRLAFFNALSSATHALLVSCCRSDEEGHPVNPSTFWEDLRGLFPAIPIDLPVKGFSLLYSTLPALEKSARNPLSNQAVECRGRRKTAAAGILGARAVCVVHREMTREPMSITALEEYALCPFAFFCRRLLNLGQLAEPTYLPDRMAEGSILHAVLRDFFRKHRGEALNDRDYQTYLEEIRALLEDYYPEVSPNRPAIYRNLSALQRETMLAKLTRLLQEEITWQQKTNGTYKPRFIELGFGGAVSDGDQDSTGRSYEIVDPGDDRVSQEGVLRLRGKIDRVDLGEDGGFVVYDYKSGGSDRVKEVKEGKLLQLPLYLQAVQELYAEARQAMGMSYYSLARSERKDGFWREGFGGRFQLKLRELKEPEWEELLAESRKKALQYYKGIISGEFPVLPPEEKCPTYCLFPRVCQREAFGGECE